MKISFQTFLLLFLFILNIGASEQYIFETNKITIDGNNSIVFAENGEANSVNQDLKIQAERFIYQKKNNLIRSYNGYVLFNKDNIKIEFKEIELYQDNFLIVVNGDHNILDTDNNLSIKTSKIEFDKSKKILSSNSKTVIVDKFKNKIITEKFRYDLKNKTIRLDDAIIEDNQKNKYYIDTSYINITSGILIGKDIELTLNGDFFNNKETRIKGRSIVSKNNITEISKGVITVCPKNDSCTPWQLKAEKISHDKKDKTIKYKNAWLEIYELPVLYFPKLVHPDPTVRRQSGFLIPSFKNSSNSNEYLSVPYYKVISDNKDLTFLPRFYDNEKFLVQTEFRQINKNSNHIADLSIFNDPKKSKGHFFYDYKKKFSLNNFDKSNLNLKIEKTSSSTYLKNNNLVSSLINNYDFLNSNLNLSLEKENLSINSNLIIYEDLNKSNNDKYEYILPKIDIITKIPNKTKLDGEFSFISNNQIRNYNTNTIEITNENNLKFNSFSQITKKGFNNNYEFIIKNYNSDAQNSSNFKNNKDFSLSGLFQLNSSLPLIKEHENFRSILKPKIALKYNPLNNKDIRYNDARIDINNIYSLERLPNNALEGGISLTYGNEYSFSNNIDNNELFNIKVANNLRLKDNEDLPKSNQLGSKTSNLFGEVSFNPNKYLKTRYNFSRKNNFKDTNFENFITDLYFNNFEISFDYLNENNLEEKNSYILNSARYNFNESNNISFSTRQNKTTNLTEYYNLIYQYKNDCLEAAIEYNKAYYSDREIKPEESIFFRVKIIPFGETSTSNLIN